ncbi:MAG: T9SS type A sorting domain-containing protein [Candidatus Cloacimonetes bacterium]|nr:T9SS type A sorting domain-containing protein [Candidatus Cloacimonadota bacterium]
MKTLGITLVFSICIVFCFAAWSTDASNPTLLAGFNFEQVIPKIAITATGEVWHCRFDNSSGNYDVYLQLYSSQGTPLFPEPEGFLVSDNPAMTWLTEYDLDCDAGGNALVTFQDIRNAGVNNVFAYKLDQEGNQLWGEDGIALSADTDIQLSNMSPTLFCSSDGSNYFAWQHMADKTSIIFHRLSSAGVKIWGDNGISLASLNESYTWPQIIQGDGDNVLLKYYVDSGPYWAPTRHLYIAKYSPTGEQLWNTCISNAGGITAWTQYLDFKSDTAGGAFIAWHDDRNSDNVNEVYLQHVDSEGNLGMSVNGALISTDTANQQYYPKIAIDPPNERIYAFYKTTDGGQTVDGLARQLMDYNGNRLWGETGADIIPLGQFVASPVAAYATSLGAICLMEFGTIPSSDQSMHLRAYCFRTNGFNPWTEEYIPLATTNTNKYHFDLDVHETGWSVLAWEEGNADNDIYAMRLNANGSLGVTYAPPIEVAATFIPPNSIEVSWEPADPGFLPESYAIYVNDALSTVLDGWINSHILENMPAGTYDIYLVAIYPDAILSEPSEHAIVTLVDLDDELSPPRQAKLMAYPNPFNPSTAIRFVCPRQENYELAIYDLRGKKMQILYQGFLPEGEATFCFAGTDRDGKALSSGIYFLRATANSFCLTRKITLLK